MDEARPPRRTLPSDWLFLVLIVSLPLMKPAVEYPIEPTDLIFLVLLGTLTIEVLLGRRRVDWKPGFAILLVYALSFAPSLLATSNLATSVVKLASEFYLVGLAAVAPTIVTDEARLRRTVLAFLAATVIVCIVAALGLASFATGLFPPMLDYAWFGFGSLPPGNYPRLCMTFFNANMACNYLTVSLGLTFGARACGWLNSAQFVLLAGGIALAAGSTISPGLGGVALLAAVWFWLSMRGRRTGMVSSVMALGVGTAVVFVVATAITPIPHSTAPFLLHLPQGMVIAPSSRFLTWRAAVTEFLLHPLIGHGIGIGAVQVQYADPSGSLETLTDAHNMFLNVAAQSGSIALAGLATLLGYAVRLTGPWRFASRGDALRLALGASFLDAFVYQGLGGSFEDARHLWVLLGLLMALASITLSDENSRRAGAPSHC